MNFDQVPWQAPVAGALGGIVRALTLRLPLLETLSAVCVGAICAIYLSPLAVPLFSKLIGALVVDDASRVGFSGFVIGTGGTASAGLVMDLWKGLRTRQKQQNKKDESE